MNTNSQRTANIKVELKHGMRTDQLKGIEDIGIKIESIKTTTP